ncbi:MAG TPA: hypothetical protein VGA24_05470 [Steroidobacteraceae bacterium]
MGRILRRFASCTLGALIASGTAADTASSTLHIEVTGGADSHGEIVFSFAEDGVDITEIPVAIPKGTPENNVARRIRKELRRALPKDQYGVDIKGGEKVLVSARGNSKHFEISLVRSTVSGPVVGITRE